MPVWKEAENKRINKRNALNHDILYKCQLPAC